MAAESRTSNLAVVPDPVEAHLRREPYCFEFLQAVQLLERLSPKASPVGHFVPPHTESVRFSAHPSLAFPASEIQSLTYREGQAPLMIVNFMGLIGPLGVLPIQYTEFIQRREQEGDTSARDFLDLFHHRIISLFYRAWQKYHYQTTHGRGEHDRLKLYLQNLVGLGHDELLNRQVVPDDALLFHAGLLTQQPRSVVGCESFLHDYFGVPVRIEQFVGAWYRLEPDAQTAFRDDTAISDVLGGGAVVGDEVWDPQAGLRVVLGPLTLAQYREFLPVGSAYQPLKTLVRFFAGEEFDFELQLILKREEVPSCELGAAPEQAPLLGWVSWSKCSPLSRDPAETILPL
jgi:type VI secretion system protein ImpH